MAQDLRNTEVAQKIESYFDAIAQGNKGDATIEMLEQDSFIIRYRVQIRHHHVWDSFVKRLTMYDITREHLSYAMSRNTQRASMREYDKR